MTDKSNPRRRLGPRPFAKSAPRPVKPNAVSEDVPVAVRFSASGLERATRLDQVLAAHFPEHSRRAMQALINGRKVRVNNRVVWLASWQVNNGDVLTLSEEPGPAKPPAPSFDDSWVVAKGADWIAVNKPAGLLSHATRASVTDDLQSLLRERFGALSIFHRLDRDTSGIVLFTHHGPINRYLDRAFKESAIIKEYLALVRESEPLPDSFIATERIDKDPKRSERMRTVAQGGQSAETRFTVLGRAEGLALLRCRPITGRTHQIRVHLLAHEAPIAGDRFYNESDKRMPRLMLHALRVTLPDLDGFPRQVLMAKPGEDFLGALPESLREVARKA